MSNNVFPDESSDTPWATPGWTVQSGPNLAGDQSLVKNAAPANFAVTSVNGKPGPTVTLTASDVGALPSTANYATVGAMPSTAVAANQAASGEASFVAPGALTSAAKLSDLQALASLVDSLNAALQNAGLEAKAS